MNPETSEQGFDPLGYGLNIMRLREKYGDDYERFQVIEDTIGEATKEWPALWGVSIVKLAERVMDALEAERVR